MYVVLPPPFRDYVQYLSILTVVVAFRELGASEDCPMHLVDICYRIGQTLGIGCPRELTTSL